MERRLWTEDGNPLRIRCYDNGGKTMDRYTVVFTKVPHYDGRVIFFASGTDPRGMSYIMDVDKSRFAVNDKRVAFVDLPDVVQRMVVRMYCDLFGINNKPAKWSK